MATAAVMDRIRKEFRIGGLEHSRPDAAGAPTERRIITARNKATGASAHDLVLLLKHYAQALGPNMQITMTVLQPGAGTSWNSFDYVSSTDYENGNEDPLGILEGGVDYDGNDHGIEFIEKAVVYIRRKPAAAGGGGREDPNNDCLYNALYHVFGQIPGDGVPNKSKADFKSWLGLQRTDPVPVEMLGRVDESLGPSCAISLHGDHEFISPKWSTATERCRLKLVGGHFDQMSLQGRKNVYMGYGTAQKPVAFYVWKCGPIDIYAEDGETLLETREREEISHWLSRRSECPYVLVPVVATKDKATGERSICIKRSAEEFRAAAEALGQPLPGLKNGLVDLRRHGTYRQASLELFARKSKNVPAPDPLEPEEEIWIAKSLRGGIIYAAKGYSGPAVKYDAVSHYPTTQSLPDLMLPLRAGKFYVLDERRPKTVGIYRATVTVPAPYEKIVKTGRGYYTHHDIAVAIALKGTVTLTKDGQPNALLYEDGLISGERVYGRFVKEMFALKKKGVPGAKQILNILWGSHCAKGKKFDRIDGTEPMTSDVLTIAGCDGDKVYARVRDLGSSLFYGEFPRFCVFIVAMGRRRLSIMAAPVAERVVHIHTDSITLKGLERPANLEALIGDELGKVRRECEGNVTVHHVNRCVWE